MSPAPCWSIHSARTPAGRSPRLLAAGALAAVLLTSCDRGTAPTPLTTADVAGTYVLQSIAGRPGPWYTRNPPSPGDSSPLVADTLVFEARGAFQHTVINSLGSAPPIVRYFSGMWTLDGTGRRLSTRDGRGNELPLTVSADARELRFAGQADFYGLDWRWARVP